MAVKCGHVYCLYFALAAKDKLLVPAYAMTDGRVRCFVVNTDLSPLLQKNPELQRHAFELSFSTNTAFLKHDSWLCCNEVIGGWTVAEIDANADCHRGPIDGGTIAAVKLVIATSALYSQKEKDLILAQWP